MSKPATCGEILVRLLQYHGVDVVFGIPGAHTLEAYRALADSPIELVLPRHEQGAGFMADGYARTSGRPGVCLLISGPGLTNAMTPLGQACQDGIPLLVVSSSAPSESLGKRFGYLHEISDPEAMTRPITAFSATARRPEDLPALFARAFAVFRSARPRPVHITIPTDVLGASGEAGLIAPAGETESGSGVGEIDRAAEILADARSPVILAGGGAVNAADALGRLAGMVDAPVVTSNAGKGTLPDTHPLSVGCSLLYPGVQKLIRDADVAVVIGTELSQGDSCVEKLDLPGQVIRVDIDAAQFNGFYPASVELTGDAREVTTRLLDQLELRQFRRKAGGGAEKAAAARRAILDDMTPVERQHNRAWVDLQETVPPDTLVFGDSCQFVYTGSFAYPCLQPRTWFWSSSWCTLGGALPMAIGAKIAEPERPVVVAIGDGGLMFTISELVTAAERRISLPVIVWNNRALKQIADLMDRRGIPQISVTPAGPDFAKVAEGMLCSAISPGSREEFRQAIRESLECDRPTLIEVNENADWL